MASVELKGVRKTYAGNVKVVHGIDLAIRDGEFIVVVGPSGCGKSTLLRMVAGLESITEGTISIDGRVVNAVEPKDRDIAMVFQNYALYPHMTVYDNMAYGLRIRGNSTAEIEVQVKRAAGILQLDALLHRRPRELSGGQRQRVAMGRAIVRQPKVFLFDEPLSNLDAKLRVQMRIEIKRLHQELGVTSIYVTHDQIEAMTLADRLVVMHAGVAEQIGQPKAVYENPATIFVAGFIGSPAMNFLPGRMVGGRVTLDDGATIDLPAPVGSGEREVTLGIRPEHVVLVDPAQARFNMTVDLAEELGADTIVYGRVAGADLVVRVPGYVEMKPGDHLALDFDHDRLHLFDRASGLRI